MSAEIDIPIKFKLLPLDKLENNSWNPNSMEQPDFDRLVAEIEEVGFIDPIEVVPLENGMFRIIGGEHRAAAGRELKMKKVPSMVLQGPQWQEEDLQKLVTVRLNALKGKLNPEKMALLYQEMAKKYGEDALQHLFAFTDKHAWNKLVSGVKQGLSKAGLPKEKQKEFNERAKEAKTLQDLERILNELWSSYGDTIHQSFMIFTYGKREHVYIAMDRKTREALKKITNHCKKTSKDINEVLGPALWALADLLSKEKAAKKAPKAERQDDVPF
jgi:hypothetical protein